MGISKGSEWGWVSPATLALLAGGLVALVGWGWFELRVTDALVDLRVSARRPILLANLAGVALGFSFFASSIVVPQLLQLPASVGGLGLPIQQASFVMAALGVSMLVFSPLAGWISDRSGPRALLLVGSIVLAATYTSASLVTPSIAGIAVIQSFVGLGIVCGFSAMPGIIVRAVPVTETGAANGLNTLARSLGTAVAAAAVATILAQSPVVIEGVAVPTTVEFRAALWAGTVSAVICGVLAVFIPRNAAGPPVTHEA